MGDIAERIVVTSIKEKYASETGCVGCIPTEIANGLNEYTYGKEIALNMQYYEADELSKFEMEKKVYKSLEKNVPSVLLVGINTQVPYRYYGNDKIVDTTEAHYMVITGLKIDNITGKTTLQVSTWSRLAFIYLEDYISNPGWLGGIIINE